MKDKIVSVALVCIIALKCMDLYIDFSEDLELIHIIQESILILISSGLFVFLIFDHQTRPQNLAKHKKCILHEILR